MLKAPMPNAASSYLDFNATTPLLPQVEAAVREALSVMGNPSSVHAAGRRARALVEDAREQIAAQTGAAPAEVIFTSGGTEANALALKGSHHASVIVSGIEHASVLAAAPGAITVPATPHGVIDLNALEAALKGAPRPALVAVMLANNETGVLQPLDQVVALAKSYGAFVHCDAVQAFGKVPVDFSIGVDSLSLSAHKVGGLKGVGALIFRGDLTAQISGGGQERRRRAGTENVLGIISFGASAREVPRLLEEATRIRALRDDLETEARRGAAGVRIYGADAPRLANTTCLSLAELTSETQVMRLDLAGIAVSAGSACSSGKIAPSHVLLAMGVAPEEARCAIRVSLGWSTTQDDIARFMEAWRPLALNAAA